jgi:hypothetical protein
MLCVRESLLTIETDWPTLTVTLFVPLDVIVTVAPTGPGPGPGSEGPVGDDPPPPPHAATDPARTTASNPL